MRYCTDELATTTITRGLIGPGRGKVMRRGKTLERLWVCEQRPVSDEASRMDAVSIDMVTIPGPVLHHLHHR